MMPRRALRVFPDRAALASSDGASVVTLVGSKVIMLSTLGVALLAIVYVWASTVLMLLNGAAVLALLFWIGVTVWRQVGRDSWLHSAFGDKVPPLTTGALHRPVLVTVLILGFVVGAVVAPAYLITAALIGVGGAIGLRRLTVVIRGAALGRHYRAHRCRVAGASAKSRIRSRGSSRGRSGSQSRSTPNATKINKQKSPRNSAFLSPYRGTSIGMKQLCSRLGR